MPNDPQAPIAPPFQIDHAELGVVLAEAFIRRVNVFEHAERITLLRACRKQLVMAAGEIGQYLLSDGDTPARSHSLPTQSLF